MDELAGTQGAMLSVDGRRWVRYGFGLLLTLGGWLPAAHAMDLFRCTGAQGEVVYSSHADGYHGCHRLNELGVPRAPGVRPSFRGVTGAAWVVATSMAEPVVQPLETPTSSFHDQTTTASMAVAEAMPAQPPGRMASTEPPVLRGAVYRVRRSDGSVEYTNLAPATPQGAQVVRLFTYIVTCMACNLHSPIHWQTVPLQLTRYAGPIEDASRQFGVDPALVRAVIHAESAFNPRAISLKGAQGLMQLMPGTASDMGVVDAFDASQNIHGGARYLALLMQQFHGDIRRVAAAYDAGAGAVIRYGGIPPYAETQVYVDRVELLFHRYQARDQAAIRQARLD
ncbi:lytic transglycosylase domain-containing protein [Frateuria aurantia]